MCHAPCPTETCGRSFLLACALHPTHTRRHRNCTRARSAGIGLSVLVYNYDGDVYASDEGRMLAEMNDRRFRLGTVRDTYRHLILETDLLSIVFNTKIGRA